MEINCNLAQDLLKLYVEDALSPESRKLAEEHISGCGECRARLAEIQRIYAELDGASDGTPVSASNRRNEDAGSFRSFKKWLAHRRAVTILVTAIIAAAIGFGGMYLIEAYESYVPYDESGITVTESGSMYTDSAYNCFYGTTYVIETVDGEDRCIEFIYLTSSIYSRNFKRKTDKKIMIRDFGEPEGESLNEDGELIDYVVTEVYYLPKERVESAGLLNNGHSALIPAGSSEHETEAAIEQLRSESVLLWKRN